MRTLTVYFPYFLTNRKAAPVCPHQLFMKVFVIYSLTVCFMHLQEHRSDKIQ